MSKRSYVQLQARLLDEASVAALAETFKVLGDTTRVRILDALARAEVPVCDLAHLLGLTQSAVSHQLRLLRGMRLVKSRRAGRHIYYVADDHHIVGLFDQGLEHVQEQAPVARAFPPSLKHRRTAEALAEAGQTRDRGTALRRAQGTPSSSKGERAARHPERGSAPAGRGRRA